MKFRFLILALLFSTIWVNAQNFDIKINAGANATYIPKFQNQLTIVDGFIIPGLYTPGNAKNPPIVVESASTPNYKAGFFADAEISQELWNNWKLSLSLGASQINYTYDNRVPATTLSPDTSMKSLFSNYGNTRMLYFSSRFLNVTKSFNRVSLQIGPVVNYLANKKFNNTYLFYDASDSLNAKAGIFEQKEGANKWLIGGHFNFRYKISPPLEIMVGTQYFFNSLYKKENTYESIYKKSKPLQLQVGLSYRIAYF